MTSDITNILRTRWRYAKYLSRKISKHQSYDIDRFIEDQFKILYYNQNIEHIDATLILEFYKSDGFGDLMIGYKCLQNLRDDLPENIRIVVTSITPNDVEKIAGSYLKKHNIHLTHVSELREYINNSNSHKTCLITFALKSRIDSDIIESLRPHTLFVDEYNGWRTDVDYVPQTSSVTDINSQTIISKNVINSQETESDYGIDDDDDDDETSVIINTEIEQVEQSDYHSDYDMDLEKFDNIITPGFGINGDRILSGLNIMNDSISNSAPYPIDYYFGYISDYHTDTEVLYKYLMYIILLNRNSMKKINIVLLTPNPDLHYIRDILNTGIHIESDATDDNHTYNSKASNILDLDVNFQIKKGYRRKIIEDEDNHIKIYIETQMPHSDVITHMKYSQEPILVTGDQSMSEAISLGKLFFYEMQEWKIELYSKFQEYMRFVSHRFTSLHYFMDKSSRLDTLDNGNLDEVITELVRKTERHKLTDFIRSISKNVRANFDLRVDLIAVVKKMLIDADYDNHHKQEVRNIIDPQDLTSSRPVKRKASYSERPGSAKRKKTKEKAEECEFNLFNLCTIC